MIFDPRNESTGIWWPVSLDCSCSCSSCAELFLMTCSPQQPLPTKNTLQLATTVAQNILTRNTANHHKTLTLTGLTGPVWWVDTTARSTPDHAPYRCPISVEMHETSVLSTLFCLYSMSETVHHYSDILVSFFQTVHEWCHPRSSVGSDCYQRNSSYTLPTGIMNILSHPVILRSCGLAHHDCP